MGAGERYHDPLRRVFKKVKHEYPSLNRELALRISVKAINDTMGPEGLVPSLLVFGCLPRFSATDSNISDQKKRMQALKEARKEMSSIKAELRIRKALMSRAPRSTDIILEPEDQVRVFRETDRKYVGHSPKEELTKSKYLFSRMIL